MLSLSTSPVNKVSDCILHSCYEKVILVVNFQIKVEIQMHYRMAKVWKYRNHWDRWGDYCIPWKFCFFLWNVINKIMTNINDLLIKNVSGYRRRSRVCFFLHSKSAVHENVILKFQKSQSIDLPSSYLVGKETFLLNCLVVQFWFIWGFFYHISLFCFWKMYQQKPLFCEL